MSRRVPRIEALVVNAIRQLQDSQGSTTNEIANYLQDEYDVNGPEIRRQILLTIRRGLNYGILEKSKRGYVTCDRSIPNSLEQQETPDCFSYKRAVRRSRGVKRGRRERRSKKSMSRKRPAKKRRSAPSRKPRAVRRAYKSPRKQSKNSDGAKVKKTKSQDMNYGRQPSNGSNSNQERSTSKSPSRNGDVKREP